MGKVDILYNRVKSFAALFWTLGIVLANTWPCPPARHHSTAAHKALTYFNSWLSSQWRCVAPCPLFLSWFIIYLCARWSSVPDCGHPGGQHTHQSPSAVSWVRIAHNNWGQFSYIRIALDGEYVCFHMIKKTKKSSNITTTFSSIFMTIYNIYYGPKFPNDRKKNSSNITTTFGSNSMTIYILRADIMHKKWEQKK